MSNGICKRRHSRCPMWLKNQILPHAKCIATRDTIGPQRITAIYDNLKLIFLCPKVKGVKVIAIYIRGYHNRRRIIWQVVPEASVIA